MIRLGIFGSTRGTNLTAIVDAISQQRLAASIEIVISNKVEAGILERAKSYSLPTQFVNPHGLTREQYEQQLSLLLKQHAVDLIVLIGYIRILSTDFVTTWANKIINVHPSLLPAFAGKMDLEIHRGVIAAGVKETGCTVHYVTADVDAGPIVIQKKCMVLDEDTPENLKARVQQLEGQALVEAIAMIEKKM
jgi:phosphoribosylglycinamide formyltransferase 1